MSTQNGSKIKGGKNFKKLCIMNVEKSETESNIRALCSAFGELEQFERVPHKNLAFPLYKSETYVHHFTFFIIYVYASKF